MAVLAAHEAVVGVVQGSAWATGVQATKRMRCENLVINDSFAPIVSANHDIGYVASKIKRGARAVAGTFSGDAGFGGEWLILYALMMGTASAPAEQTGSQADYLHNLDPAVTHSKFGSLAYEIETDVVGAVPSFKMNSFSLSGAVNDKLRYSCGFIGDTHINTGGATTNAQLDALAFEDTEEHAVFNGSAAYFRYDDYSASTALTSADNVNVTSWSLSLQRPITSYYGLRGALSDKTYEPYPSGLLRGTLTFTLANIDDGSFDLFTDYTTGAPMMAEIFIDGGQIGTGVNTSLKIQIPYMTILSLGGYGIGGQATLQQPTITCDLAVAPAAPSGMSGVTRLARLVSIDGRTTAYLA